ncbi:MAG: Gfo/Idh/MocA family oxidoreductase [Acidobacteria bacterium]|nr:Gfo/Idh/MocA family oxidoreductase [Acidobacteriota bacterium]MCI0722348.1 Gfo/Idh/MocA family oxidoreductase [Acidobacteriota bacterium]
MEHDDTASSAPTRVGIIGAGNVLWAYLQVLDRLVPKGLAVLSKVCARRCEKWRDLQSRRPGIPLVADPLEVLKSDVEIVAIITPPESHAELTRLALEHNKHVVTEKPLALKRSEAVALVELAAKKNRLLLTAPFVQLSPTFRVLWGQIRSGAIGRVHSARGLYGNAGSTWARWYHESKTGPLGDLGIYNLKSLTALLGPVTEVLAAEATAVALRQLEDGVITHPDPDVSHLILRHEGGALSSVVSSHAIQRYRRPGLELYGTEGTANLLGDDWDPRGFEIWRNAAGCWEEFEPVEGTWLWADGLREAVLVLREQRPPLAELTQDLHLLEILEAAQVAAQKRTSVSIASRFHPLNLQPESLGDRQDRHHLHDHTRPADEQ